MRFAKQLFIQLTLLLILLSLWVRRCQPSRQRRRTRNPLQYQNIQGPSGRWARTLYSLVRRRSRSHPVAHAATRIVSGILRRRGSVSI